MSSPPLRGRWSWHRSVTRGESRTTRDTPEVRVGTEQERGRRERVLTAFPGQARWRLVTKQRNRGTRFSPEDWAGAHVFSREETEGVWNV